MASKATIFDVASLAGVSRGTVDRVVYHRGTVSEDARFRVEKAIAELGYKPNESASKLASKKIYRIASLTPEPGEADYWEKIDNGFDDGIELAARSHNVELTRYHFDQNDRESFERAAMEILETNPHGVILTDVFQLATRNLAAELHTRKIPFAFLDTKDDNLPYATFFGVNGERSGALGAHLVSLAVKNPRNVAIISIKRDPALMSDPNGKRREGFIKHLGDQYPDCKFHQVIIDPGSTESIAETMDIFTKDHPGVKCFVVLSSRLYLITGWLAANHDPERTVIGYEDLDANMEALRKGLATFLITRHIPHQSRDILVEFTKYLAGGTLQTGRDNYIHMDILCRMNINDYQ